MIPSATTIQRYANTHGVDPKWREGISINMIVHFLEVLDGQEVALDKDTWHTLAGIHSQANAPVILQHTQDRFILIHKICADTNV
jgi:hypothetical protein